jgi:hypothetical protein
MIPRAQQREPNSNFGVTYAKKPSELWGVGSGPKTPKRGPEARQRRRQRAAAKRARMPLKAWLRAHGGGGAV